MVSSTPDVAVGRDSASPAPGSAPQDAQGPSPAASGSPVRQQADSDAAPAPAVADVAGGAAARQDAGTLKRKLSGPLPMTTDSSQGLGSGGLRQQSEANLQEGNTRPEADDSVQSGGGLSAAEVPASATEPAAAGAAAHKGEAPHTAAASSKALAGDGQAPAAERSSSKPAGLGGAGLGRGKGAPARGKKAGAGGGRTSAPPPAAAAALLRAAAASSTPDAAGSSSSGTGAGTSSGQGQQTCLLPVHAPPTLKIVGAIHCCLAPELPVDRPGEQAQQLLSCHNDCHAVAVPPVLAYCLGQQYTVLSMAQLVCSSCAAWASPALAS